MLTVGQELWYVPSDGRNRADAQMVRVSKVGRRWADLEPSHIGRVDIDSLWLDGGNYSSAGRCWLSKEAWETDVLRKERWMQLKNRLGYTPPDHVDLEMIKTISQMLFP